MTPYTLKVSRHRRRRRMALSVAPGGVVHARVPYGISLDAIQAFVSAHQDWIVIQQQQIETVHATSLASTLCPG